MQVYIVQFVRDSFLVNTRVVNTYGNQQKRNRPAYLFTTWYTTKGIWAKFNLQRTRWVLYFASRTGWLDSYKKTTKLGMRDLYFAVGHDRNYPKCNSGAQEEITGMQKWLE